MIGASAHPWHLCVSSEVFRSRYPSRSVSKSTSFISHVKHKLCTSQAFVLQPSESESYVTRLGADCCFLLAAEACVADAVGVVPGAAVLAEALSVVFPALVTISDGSGFLLSFVEETFLAFVLAA